MTGSADVAPGYGPDPQAGHNLADAAPPASGSTVARDGVDIPGGDAPAGPAWAADEDEPFPDDGGAGGRYVPL